MALVIHGRLQPEVMPQTLTNKLQRAANNTEIMIDGDGETWASPARGYATNAHQ